MTLLFLSFFRLFAIATCYTYQTHWNPDYDSYQQVSPQEIMVDVINNLGLHLLAIHNDNNDNNIAISPYGAASVLVALREGVRGEAVREIHTAAHIPRDISVTRVGLRDIHRHLKSYFIPKEGFLAGLTLSHDNVTLHPEYEKILRFYGYDIDSFNSALYPDPETTVQPTSSSQIIDLTNKEMSTTEEMMTTITDKPINEDATLESKTEEATTEKLTTEKTTPETTTVTTTTTTTTEKTDTTKTTKKTPTQTTQKTTTTEETTKNRPSTIMTTPKITTRSTTATTTTKTVPTSKTTPVTTTKNTPKTTPRTVATTLENREKQTETTTRKNRVESTTTNATLFTSQKLEDSTKETETSTSSESTTMDESTTTSTTKTTTIQVPFKNDNQTTVIEKTESTTMEITSTTETTSNPNSEFETMTPTDESTLGTNTESVAPTVKIVSRSSSPLEDLPDTKLIEKTAQFESRRLTTTTFGYEYPSTEPNYEKAWLDVDSDANTNSDNLNDSARRDIRSVVDYVVARYYDSQNMPNKETYRPREELTFLVNGKYRESNINFMSYDTVLPFYYISHLNALALSFPLDSTKYYLLLILPVDENGVEKLVCDLKKTTSLKHIIRNLKYTHIKAVIPSFMLKGYVILTPTLQKLGIRSIFEPRHADFSPMTDEKDIYVTNIEQAITVTIRNYVDPNSIQNHRNLYQYGPVEFKADHPFLYFVIDSEIHVTLMAGKIINPLNSRIR